MDLIDPNKWKPIKGRITHPNNNKGYKAVVSRLITKVVSRHPKLPAASKLTTPKDAKLSEKDERIALEEMVLAQVLRIAQEAAKKHPNKRNAGFDAVNAAYPGISTDLDEIFKNHRDTNLGREIYENADLLVGPLHIDKYTKQELAQIQQARNALPKDFKETETVRNLTNKEKEYIRTTESPGIPRDNRQQWITKGLSSKNENRKIISGDKLAIASKKVEMPNPDGSTTKVNLNILLDAHGRLREDILFPTSSSTYIQDRAKILQEAFAETFTNNQIFGDTLGLSSKLTDWMDLERYQPGQYRKELPETQQNQAGIERLYGTEEGKARIAQITQGIAKMEFAVPMNEKIRKHFDKRLLGDKPPPLYTGKEIAKAVGINYSDCFAPKTKKIPKNFDGYRAFLLSKRIDPDDTTVGEDKLTAEQQMIKYLTNTYYIEFGFREFRSPIKDELGVTQIGAQQGMIEYNDTGWRPNQDAAEAFVKDMLDKIGNTMFTGDSYTLGLGIEAKTIQGPDGIRVRVEYADGRVLYYDPDNYWDIAARTMAADEAAVLHQQIQGLARDPINYAVAWYYSSVGNAMINMIPGARSAYGSIYRILKQRNSFLPKPEQISGKAIKDWSTLIIKRTLLAPMYVYDPKSNYAIPRYAYLIRSGINWGIDSLAGTELQPGALDKFLTKTGILGKYEWYWAPPLEKGEKGEIRKREWEPRIFKQLMRSRRLRRSQRREPQSIFDLAIQMGYGIFVNMIGARIVNLATKSTLIGRAVGRVTYGIQQLRAYPMGQINKVWGKLPITVQGKLANTWNWTKVGWQSGGTVLKTAGQALIPAVLAGVIFNSPLAFAVAAIGAGVPAGFMNFAKLAGTNTFFASKFESWDTLSKLLYKPHAEAAVVLNPQSGTFAKLPKLFGLEHQIYEKVTLSTGAKAWQMKNTGIARFLSNHANIRGILKGTGKATYAFSIIYALTGSYVWAGAAAVGTVAGSIVYENVLKVIAKRLPGLAGKLTAISGTASAVGSVAMGSVTLALGLNFIRGGVRALFAGGDEWKEWKNENFGNAISSSLSVMTIFGVVTSIASVFSASGTLGTLLKPVVGLFSKSGLGQGIISWTSKAFGTWGVVGAFTGFIIGAIFGGIFGAQLGATIGGTIFGAIGGVFGGMLLGAKLGTVIGTFFGPIVGSIIGGIIGGTIGAIFGIIVEKIIQPRIEGLVQGFKTAFNLIGNAMNVLQAIKMLLSGDLAEVGVGALMLCLAGVFTFATLTTSSMTAASHIETGWTESGGGELPPEATILPIQIRDFKKTLEGGGFTDEDKSITFRIHVSNSDDEGRNITTRFEDTLTLSNQTVQEGISYEIISGGPTVENRNGSQLILNQENGTTMAVGESNDLVIKFTSNTQTFPELISSMPNEKMCNRVKLTGQIENGNSLEAATTICIDPEGNVTGPGGKCPVDPNLIARVWGCHGWGALDLSLRGNNDIYAPADGTISRIMSPEYITNVKKLKGCTGCYDGGWTITIKGDDGNTYDLWHVVFDTSSMNTFITNGSEIEVGDRVNEGQIVAKLWDGGSVDGGLATCYLNQSGGNSCGGTVSLYGTTYWTGPHLHFSIPLSTRLDCSAVINYYTENCHDHYNSSAQPWYP